MRASRVLVIEKDEATAAQIGVTLEKAGFEVVTAVGAYDGLRKLLEAYPDLIIMAQELPAVDGEDALLRIRQASYILMMVLGPADEELDAFELGADAYMSRPPSDVELVAKARSLLRRKLKMYDPPVIGRLSARSGEGRT